MNVIKAVTYNVFMASVVVGLICLPVFVMI